MLPRHRPGTTIDLASAVAASTMAKSALATATHPATMSSTSANHVQHDECFHKARRLVRTILDLVADHDLGSGTLISSGTLGPICPVPSSQLSATSSSWPAAQCSISNAAPSFPAIRGTRGGRPRQDRLGLVRIPERPPHNGPAAGPVRGSRCSRRAVEGVQGAVGGAGPRRCQKAPRRPGGCRPSAVARSTWCRTAGKMGWSLCIARGRWPHRRADLCRRPTSWV